MNSSFDCRRAVTVSGVSPRVRAFPVAATVKSRLDMSVFLWALKGAFVIFVIVLAFEWFV